MPVGVRRVLATNLAARYPLWVRSGPRRMRAAADVMKRPQYTLGAARPRRSVRRAHVVHHREMACSSLYRPDPSLTGSLPELACASEIGISKIPVTTLDEWATSAGISAI